MRISSSEIDSIQRTLKDFSKNGIIYLHGSRIDDHKKGGDIDLFFIVPDKEISSILEQKHFISSELSLNLNEQKVDIIFLSQSQSHLNDFFVNSNKIKL